MNRTALVTGTAGFVGAALTERLLNDGWNVIGIDNVNDYYSPTLKEARLAHLASLSNASNHQFHRINLTDREALVALALATKPDVIIHLAAQASVRYGLVNQVAYLEANLIGHFNMLAMAKALADSGHPVQHFLYASSSSVYGANAQPGEETVAFSEADDVSRPVSLYAATKRANELITHSWSHQFGMPASGLRFFTVYGPWGRPDMTPVMFSKLITEGKPIPLFNGGDLWRDFTYIDDIIEAIVRLIPVPPVANPTPHVVYNLGNQSPVQMKDFVETLGKAMGVTPVIDPQDWPATEVYKTFADTSRLKAAVGWVPSTPLADGLARLAVWYKATGHAILSR
ncbi:MAG: NAD-dependent epimerase/dehydratase family protein [Alphaproteobacteria bacterium]|nr:MAG: NAD-dependent epimerase/dehydratase family protein [Alphaproteobacteria bacterium]